MKINLAHKVLFSLAGLLSLTSAAYGMTPEERRLYRQKLIQILPDAPAFGEWLRKTDELPPDFDALPRINGLPDPRTFLDGRPVKTQEDWKARRAEIRRLFEKYAWGSLPPHPRLDRADAKETQAQGYRTRSVLLHFGPQSRGSLHVTLVIPEGKGPFPVLMGPGLIGGFGGNTSGILLRRGYITAGYAGSDADDDSAALAALYPEQDFATLPRRAWAATMVLDYLETVPEADMGRVGIYGYSRDGKQALIAAALDERIRAVLAGSTGVGGALPFRFAGERNQAEGIESTTRMFPDWFHPRLRFFSGREDRLPIDGNLLVALLAPRACLIQYGLNDEVSSAWGNEACYRNALQVYEWMGAPERLGILRVPGFHGANDMEACLDWLDIQFSRSARTWTNSLLFPWDFEQWRAGSKEAVDLNRYPPRRGSDILAGGSGAIQTTADWERRVAEIRESVQWMLGKAPPMMPLPARSGPPGAGGRAGTANPGQTTPDVVAWVIGRESPSFGWLEPEKSQTASRSIRFGYNVRGDLYYPAGAPEGAKLPAVIWLHGYSYPLGYMWVYRRDLHPILALVKAGYAVLAFDQCGFGSRMSEAAPFYDRYPHWSQMGRMVEDARAAVDALQADSLVDPERIYLFGYSLGGMVGLHTAALDPRVQGMVSIAGFTPMRTDTADKGTGGIGRYSHERGLLPRLGFFVGQEARIPYDYDEILAAIAPRPVLVVQPQLDRDGTPGDVRAAVERAGKIYALHNAAGKLTLREPWDYTRLPTTTQNAILQWMRENCR